MNEPDHFRLLSFDVMKEIFSEEMEWIRNNRFKMIEKYPDFLDLLSQNQFSQWHVCQVRRQMDIEVGEAAKKLADEQKKVRSPSQLTGGYVRQ